jgi:diadenosine tetraphosphate (Ap4A) HIT family hydrolase
MSVFTLDPRHEQDSIFIKDLTLSQLRLFNRSELLWLILIPRVANVTEFYELSTTEQALLSQEITLVSNLLKNNFPCDKLNIATLGNVVPQLHMHIIARRIDDPFWPKPVFGALTQPYSDAAATTLVEQWRALLS